MNHNKKIEHEVTAPGKENFLQENRAKYDTGVDKYVDKIIIAETIKNNLFQFTMFSVSIYVILVSFNRAPSIAKVILKPDLIKLLSDTCDWHAFLFASLPAIGVASAFSISFFSALKIVISSSQEQKLSTDNNEIQLESKIKDPDKKESFDLVNNFMEIILPKFISKKN